jgi:transketolase
MNDDLIKIAKSVRRRIFDFKTSSGSGHLASSLSVVEILVSMYCDPHTIFDPDQDILIFSKAHASPALYPILVDRGMIDASELEKYCRKGGSLRLHSDSTIPGCYYVGGSLGNGIGYAAGLAYENPRNVFVILGDGELYEGSVWESLTFIAHHHMKNMKLIVDRNQLCILGATEELLRLEPLKDKFSAFGFNVAEVDGHDFDSLRTVFGRMPDRPEVVIANTVKGKGVSYMEGKWEYHTIIPKDPELIRIGKGELS